jgi:acetyltransferase-like isoleucine patch superfamily enzyme
MKFFRTILYSITSHEILAYENYVNNKKVSFISYFFLFIKAIINLFEFLFRYIPGPIGIILRRALYKILCKKVGKGVIIDVGVSFSHPWNISIDDFAWIDVYVQIAVPHSEVKIGKRVHIGPFTTIGGRAGVEIQDFVGISSHVSIFSGSATPVHGKRMTGPMLPMKDQAFYNAPVTLERDSVVGTKCVILPGVTMKQGSVLGALTTIDRDTIEWGIYKGTPAILSPRRRKKVDENAQTFN